MKYKLLVLDLDGTLTNNKKEITPRTLESLLKLQASGVQLVLASGRPTYGITPLAEQLQMSRFGGYILSFNGGKIIQVQGMETIFEQVLPLELVPSLHAAASGAGAVILTYENEFILTEQPDDKYVGHEVFLTKMSTKRVDDFSAAITFNPDKCLIVGEPDSLVPLADSLNGQFGELMSAYRSEPFFLEVVPRGIDKALSLQRLFEHVGCTAEDIVAVGDGFNDLTMIQLAGFGVAMANAQDVVKDAADYVTLSNEEDGVAELVDQFLL